MTEPNGNHGEKDKHGTGAKGKKTAQMQGRSCEGDCGLEVVALLAFIHSSSVLRESQQDSARQESSLIGTVNLMLK